MSVMASIDRVDNKHKQQSYDSSPGSQFSSDGNKDSPTANIPGGNKTHQAQSDYATKDAVKTQETKSHDVVKDAPKPMTGEESSAQAVAQASNQQDKGQNWQAFADKPKDYSATPTVADLAAEEQKSDEQKKAIKAAELQFELQIKQQGIKC